MLSPEFNNKLQIAAYRLIRQKARSMEGLNDSLTDSELGEYVRGVVDLQTEIYQSRELYDALKDSKEGK